MSSLIDDANTVAEFLADNAKSPDMIQVSSHTAIVLVGSAILPTMRAVFDLLTDAKIVDPITLVICGGQGHSTSLLRSAVTMAFPDIAEEDVANLPEARIFEKAMRVGWPELTARIQKEEIHLVIEEQSTNCGANAIMTVDMLVKLDIRPETLVVVQDPTMMRRTIASFEKAYENLEKPAHASVPSIQPWSTFTPHLKLNHDNETPIWDITDFCCQGASINELWTTDRFLELVVGEIDRLFDGPDGYGPVGKGYINHVDVPEDVLGCWKRLKAIGLGRMADAS